MRPIRAWVSHPGGPTVLDALARAGAVPAVRSRIVPAAAALPKVFAGAVDLLTD